MTVEELYTKIKAMTPIEVKKYIKTLSADDYEAYRKYCKKLTNKKYLQDPQTRARWNMEKRDYMAQKRDEDPEKNKAINIIHNQTYRDKKREAKNIVKDILDDIVDNVVIKSTEKKEAKDIANSILNDIIDTIPTQVKLKKNREATSNSRARAKGADVPLKKVGRPKTVKK